MSTEQRWQRLQDLFHAACELPTESRETFIQRNSSDDALLRDELLAMLRIEGSATHQVRQPMRSTRALIEATQTLPPGARFGPWAVDQPIGRGGMGQVYLAHRADGAYEREVALKLVSQSLLDAHQRACFEVERQWLAQMHHPVIAQIHDAGTDEQGRPWLVMEYIQGEPITHFCEQHALNLRQRIELFLRVCDGVLHAHQKGVVHRDIKPANVLVSQVDGIPTPHLIDFGIATGAGDTAQPAGTPSYMSPEQADPAQQGDNRSDIYSLGALLYEIVSGKRPPAAGEDDDTRVPSHRIRTLNAEDVLTLAERRGLKPQHLIRTLREDLDWVVTRAMQPDPAKRYQSISLLTDDLHRFLDGYPVSAAPARRSVAVRKFIARHRLGASAAALVLLALVGGLAGTLWALQKAEREATRTRVTADFLGSVLSSVDPDVARDLDKTLMLRVLDEAATRVSRAFDDDARGRIDVETIIAETYTSLGMPEKALPLLQSAREVARQHFGSASQQDLLIAQRLGEALVSNGHFAESEAVLREAIDAAAKHPALAASTFVPDMRSRLSWTLRQRGNTEEALAQARQAYETLTASTPENHSQRLDAGQRLAILLSDAGHYDEAIALLGEMIALRTEERGFDHPRVLSMRLSLGVFHLQKRDYAGGEAIYKALLEPAVRQLGAGSSMVTMIHGNLAGALRQQGKVEEAGPHYRFAYEQALKQGGPEAPNTIMTRHNLANWLLDAGQTERAHEEQRACLLLAERVFGAENSVTAEVLRGLGLSQIALGQLSEARTSLERALAIKTSLYGDADGPLARIRESIDTLEAAEEKVRTVTEQ